MVVSKEGPKEPKELEIKSQSHQTMNDFLRMVRDEDFLDFIQDHAEFDTDEEDGQDPFVVEHRAQVIQRFLRDVEPQEEPDEIAPQEVAEEQEMVEDPAEENDDILENIDEETLDGIPAPE